MLLESGRCYGELQPWLSIVSTSSAWNNSALCAHMFLPGQLAHVKKRWVKVIGLTCYWIFCFLHVQSCLTWKTILSLYSCGFWVYFFSCSRAGWLVGKFTHHHGSSWPESSIVCFSNACLLYFALAHCISLWGLWSGWPGSRSAYVKMVVPQDRDVFRSWVHVVVYLDLTKPSKWFVVCCCNGWACRKSS